MSIITAPRGVGRFSKKVLIKGSRLGVESGQALNFGEKRANYKTGTDL